MKINHIAAAALVPAIAAGIGFGAVPFAQAAPVPAAAHTAAPRHASPPRPRSHHRRHHTSPAAIPARPGAVRHTVTRPGPAGSATQGSEAASSQQHGTSTASDTYTGQGVSAFEKCVAWRESGNTPTDPDGLFGILPYIWHSLGYSGTAGQAPVSVQQQAFDRLYAQYGAQPWAPSDGC
jgi:hypothetical protein